MHAGCFDTDILHPLVLMWNQSRDSWHDISINVPSKNLICFSVDKDTVTVLSFSLWGQKFFNPFMHYSELDILYSWNNPIS